MCTAHCITRRASEYCGIKLVWWDLIRETVCGRQRNDKHKGFNSYAMWGRKQQLTTSSRCLSLHFSSNSSPLSLGLESSVYSIVWNRRTYTHTLFLLLFLFFQNENSVASRNWARKRILKSRHVYCCLYHIYLIR